MLFPTISTETIRPDSEKIREGPRPNSESDHFKYRVFMMSTLTLLSELCSWLTQDLDSELPRKTQVLASLCPERSQVLAPLPKSGDLSAKTCPLENL